MQSQEFEAFVTEYQLYVLIDQSGSMAICDCPNGLSRWNYVKEQVTGLAHEAAAIDADGIDIILFGGTVDHYSNITGSNIDITLSKVRPRGTTPMLDALKIAHSKTENKKAFFIIFTDGEPDGGQAGQVSVAKEIVAAVNKQQNDEQQTHLFIQVGNDAVSTAFLSMLDNDLQSIYKAKYDAVDVVLATDAVHYTSLSELLMKSMKD